MISVTMPAQAIAKPAGQRFALRILIADDSLTSRTVTEKMLQKCGFLVDAVVNGAEAVQTATERGYDVILMDYHMPVMDGLEATRQIRAWEKQHGRAPVFIAALTAGEGAEDRHSCLTAGMDDFLTKPVALPDMQALIHRREHFLSAPVHKKTAAKSSHQLVDVKDLLRRNADDRELAAFAMQLFLDDCQRAMATLVVALRSGDLPSIRLHAHALKGAAYNVSGLELGALAKQMEDAAAQGQLAAARHEFPLLQQAAIALRIELTRLLATDFQVTPL